VVGGARRLGMGGASCSVIAQDKQTGLCANALISQEQANSIERGSYRVRLCVGKSALYLQFGTEAKYLWVTCNQRRVQWTFSSVNPL